MAITIHREGKTLTVEAGSDRSVLDMARATGWHVEAPCGGRGFCARCNVLLGEGRYLVFDQDISVAPEQRREVLACQTRVLSEQAELFLPHSSLMSLEGARIDDDIDLPDHPHNPRFKQGFGIAVDVGTTTVVAALIDLEQGTVLERASLYNQQILKAEDVVSRISLCSEDGLLDVLQSLVMEHTLNPLIHKLCADAGIDPQAIVHLAISGNTVMMHIFFGVSPVSIGVSPFTPVSRTFSCSAAELGVDAHPDARVEAVPAISGYVGGDITSDLYVSNVGPDGGLVVLVDIGTNGEMVASCDGHMAACATAAGPVFEGGGLLHGMRASSRAIDTIRFDAALDVEYTVIGDPSPMGLCGSAIIDFMAEAFRCGLINAMGRYDVEMLKSKHRYECVNGMHACKLVDSACSATGESITVTEGDVAEILKAKAAIYSGLKTLLAELGKTVHEIDRLILAGGFARHINIENAIGIGLLPDIGIDKYKVIGNGSLAGAALLLLNQGAEPDFLELIEQPRIVELNRTDGFINYFQEALAIPNLDETDFPNRMNP